MTPAHVHIWEEPVSIPTYGVGEPDRNPMFFEKRVYQGSSGRVYPYPLIESVSDEKQDREWRAVFLENEYLKIMVLPEIGGRIHRALDKTNGYDFIYHNRVIKPALVGLAGPWISGGIEFNWPQHHRPSTFQPVDYRLVENEDGSATVWVGEIEQMSRLRGIVGITLRPGVARIDIEGVSINRTTLPQTMLWWANPAVAVNDDYQSVFPPDVQAVMDHGKRDVSRFPIAVGTYYNQDYSHGVDISWYRNIPVPTSYMVAKSRYDFCGGYDHRRQAGLLHVADRHVSPGKKQWTWGAGEFGQVWGDHLTDEDGPYIELMTGVYTDNQPDFAWLHPGEEKRFHQHFFPCRDIGYTCFANREGALSLVVGNGIARVGVYTTSRCPGTVRLLCQDAVLLEQTVVISPDSPCVMEVAVPSEAPPHAFHLVVLDDSGNEIAAWSPEPPGEVEIPAPAQAAKSPAEINTVEELYLTGLHLEQYRHATREPEPYYREGLSRDPGDARCNNALGLLLLRRGLLAEAETHFRRAVQRLTLRNGNPYDGEALYNLGLALEYQEKFQEAMEPYGRAAWNEAWKSPAWTAMARIDCRMGRHRTALDRITPVIERTPQHPGAQHLRAILLRLRGQLEPALSYAEETLRHDPLNLWALNEKALVLRVAGKADEATNVEREFLTLGRGKAQTHLELALDYAAAGRFDEARALLSCLYDNDSRREAPPPMVLYFLAEFSRRLGDVSGSDHWSRRARETKPDHCFPHRIEEAILLERALANDPTDARAWQYLGNLRYDARRHVDAAHCWEQARLHDPKAPGCRRNLALAYYNKLGRPADALRELTRAFELDPGDARVFFELDQLRRKLNHRPEDRLAALLAHLPLVERRDDLTLELVTIHNRLGHHHEALRILLSRNFHPWEGGEGKTTGQYTHAHVQLARRALAAGDADSSLAHLEAARKWPRSLGEGRLHGIQENHLDYWSAMALRLAHRSEESRAALERAAGGSAHLAMSMFYYDQPPDMVYYQGLALAELGRQKEALGRFHRLIDHGERHLNQVPEIDYFAISLPDFLVFEDDLETRHRVHCLYLMALGHTGKGNSMQAKKLVEEIHRLDAMHLGATAI